jgi:hypothetical protein
VPASYTVSVIPNSDIHIELLWHTPNDKDEFDQGPKAGSNVDLHFAHNEYAAKNPDTDGDGSPDVWFDDPFDCYWFNSNPNWGAFEIGIDDNPKLSRSDSDGAGPDILNLNLSEDPPEPWKNPVFRVGVHYWDDQDFGSSQINLRIYMAGKLVWEKKDIPMNKHDLWDAATIDWTSGTITDVVATDGGYKITPNYKAPLGTFSGCSNGKKDKAESDTDCGGWCPDCSEGKTCNADSDCLSEICTEGVCG